MYEFESVVSVALAGRSTTPVEENRRILSHHSVHEQSLDEIMFDSAFEMLVPTNDLK
jgi:hypothetical protein